MSRVLFVYSTTDGHTVEICRRLADAVTAAGHDADLVELTPGYETDPDAADCIVVAASIRYGKHRPEVREYIEAHRPLLEAKPSAFVSVNAVARKPEKQSPETNPYVRKFLAQITWTPGLVGIFGGRIDYPRYGFFDRTMIRFIMWMTRGPTDPSGTYDFTDWDAVDAFGRRIEAMAQQDETDPRRSAA